MNKSSFTRLILVFTISLGLFTVNTIPLVPVQASGAVPALALPAASSLYDWLQFNGDARHSGSNTLEKSISTSNVNQLVKLFQVSLSDVVDGAPVYLKSATTAAGVKNLLFVTTRTGDIAALDASTGVQVWIKHNPAAGCLINKDSSRNETCYTTSSPAIDPGRQFVYSYGLDGYVHKYAVSDGSETVTGGWPELASLKVYDEKGSSALAIATAGSGVSYLYVAQSGYPGDAGDYQGHLTSINLSDGTQKVFNTLCSNKTVHFVDSRVTSGTDCPSYTMGAIWARPGVVYDSNNDLLYMTTGNADFTPASFRWGDTVFALHPDGTGTGTGNPVDSYTPTNFASLEASDTDLGSTAPAILPPASGKYPHLAIQAGKDSVLRLLNIDDLSGTGSVGHTGGEVFKMSSPMGGEILTQPAVWVNPANSHTWVFVSDGSGSAGLELVVDGSGNPSLVSRWTSGAGTSPIVANGVLFYVRGGRISALNPITGGSLWSSTLVGGIHWQSPIVANGVLYITDQNGNLTAFSLPTPSQFSKITPTDLAVSQPSNPTLSWAASTGATSYRYCIDTSNNSACNSSWISTSTTTHVDLSGLTPGKTYYWQVRGINTSGSTYANSGTWWSFIVAPVAPGAFSKSTPTNAAIGQATNPTLSWGTSSGATSYKYCIDTSNNSACNTSWISTGTTTHIDLSGLTPGKTYYWQVRGINTSGSTYANGGTWWSFTTTP